MQSNDLLSLSAAVKAGYGSISTLQRHIVSGDLPSIKMGRARMVRVSDLENMRQAKQGHVDLTQVYDSLVRKVAQTAPMLSDEQKGQIIALLAPETEAGEGR